MDECNSRAASQLRIRPNLLRRSLDPRGRVQQRTAEQIEDAPQSLAEVVEAVTSVPRERVQQRTAGQIEDAPQSPADVVGDVWAGSVRCEVS